MKYFLAVVLITALGTACKQKVLSGEALKNKLIETMQDHLDKEAHPGIKFKVRDVNYFPEAAKKYYDCEFHVDMRTDKTDTIGVMTAHITNDFKKVVRIQ